MKTVNWRTRVDSNPAPSWVWGGRTSSIFPTLPQEEGHSQLNANATRCRITELLRKDSGAVGACVGKGRIDQRAQDAQNHHDDQYFDEGKCPSMKVTAGERSHNKTYSNFRRME